MHNPPHTSRLTGDPVRPSFEKARVSDAMRPGVLTCPPETVLRTVARMMATYHVHAIVVTPSDPEGEDESAWAVVSDIDVARAAGEDVDYLTAHGAAATEAVTVQQDEMLSHAAQVMAEHEIAHLIVVASDSKRPLGMLSTLDVAGIVAWGRDWA